MKIETAAVLLNAVSGGCTPQRLQKLTTPTQIVGAGNVVIRTTQEVPDTATLIECADEKTGIRFGQAKCRAGRCLKIGSGGRNKGDAYAYQIWAVW
jgi:hypothetical protein